MKQSNIDHDSIDLYMKQSNMTCHHLSIIESMVSWRIHHVFPAGFLPSGQAEFHHTLEAINLEFAQQCLVPELPKFYGDLLGFIRDL